MVHAVAMRTLSNHHDAQDATATDNGAGVSTSILQLAAKAASGTQSISITTSITSIAILMKTKATLVAAILLALAAVGTTAYVVNHENSANQSEAQDTDPGKLAAPAEGRDAKARQRATQFQSLEEAERALLDFDAMPILESRDEEAQKRCLYRLRGLVAKIPTAYYSELATRFRKGSDMNFNDYFRQMAIYTEWGRQDFDAAVADLARIDDARMDAKALACVFTGSMEADPRAAMKKAETLVIESPHEFGDAERNTLMNSVFKTWAESNSIEAIEWAKQAKISDSDRQQWIAKGLHIWKKKDPESAEKWRKKENFTGYGH